MQLKMFIYVVKNNLPSINIKEIQRQMKYCILNIFITIDSRSNIETII